MLHKKWIDCDVTINYVFFDVAFNLPSNYYVVYSEHFGDLFLYSVKSIKRSKIE
jgi:hypothetical protein